MQNNKLLTKIEGIKFFLDTLEDSKIISVDIEFMRRNTFFPEPCVIQISDGNNHGCIDLTLEVSYKEIFKSILIFFVYIHSKLYFRLVVIFSVSQ